MIYVEVWGKLCIGAGRVGDMGSGKRFRQGRGAR